jgi:hypothetical protein
MTAQDRARLFPPTVEEQLLLSEFFYYNSYYGTRVKTAEATRVKTAEATRVKTAEAIEEAGVMVQTELD